VEQWAEIRRMHIMMKAALDYDCASPRLNRRARPGLLGDQPRAVNAHHKTLRERPVDRLEHEVTAAPPAFPDLGRAGFTRVSADRYLRGRSDDEVHGCNPSRR
jgi:hypothetical protein